MRLFKESDLRVRAGRGIPVQKSAAAVLGEKVQASTQENRFDIFLSHSMLDQQLILGIWLSLEDMGYKVYVDWINDSHMEHDKVTQKTAQLLRERMRGSKCLFFATTDNSSTSKWMPWELGFKDGHNQKAAILPVSQVNADSYAGQEYLGVYYYISKAPIRGQETKGDRLWINASKTRYVLFEEWLEGKEPSEH